VIEHWCDEVTVAQTEAVIRLRKEAGLSADTNILDLDGTTVVQVKPQDKATPLIYLQTSAQQIHCIRNREGEVVEGAEDLIEQKFYLFVFQRNDMLEWRVVGFAPIFTQNYY
jgi:import inner membrane translocase subunit TIM44